MVPLLTGSPKLGVLVDPDHHDDPHLELLLDGLSLGLADVILVGGRTTTVTEVDQLIKRIKSRT